MNKLLQFLKRISVFVIFVLIEILALRYYSSSSIYSKARIAWAANATVGAVSRRFYDISSYFYLAGENRALNSELANLRQELELLRADTAAFRGSAEQRYLYMAAGVVDNTVTKQRNYIIVDKGLRDGVYKNMAILSAGNIAGYVVEVSERFSIAISLLNIDFRSSGKVKGVDYFGSIFWDGLSREHITLSEVSKYAQISVGDTIVSTGYSSIFPPDVNIGTIEEFELKNNTYYDIKVRLGVDMSAINYITLVSDINGIEKQLLLESVE